MHGKTHKEIETLRPLKDGVIADFQSSEQMIRGFIDMIQKKRSILSPALKMVICIPSGVTEVEKRGGNRFSRTCRGKRCLVNS